MIDVQTTIQRERYGLILRSISRYKRITRSELAKILKVSSSALVKYIKTLINAGIISETDQMDGNGGGRRSVFLEYNPKGGSIIGVAIYRTYVDAGILAINGDLLDNRVYPCPEILEKEAFLAELFGMRPRSFWIEIGHAGFKMPDGRDHARDALFVEQVPRYAGQHAIQRAAAPIGDHGAAGCHGLDRGDAKVFLTGHQKRAALRS